MANTYTEQQSINALRFLDKKFEKNLHYIYDRFLHDW
jgi:hypothetical protein